MAKTESKTKGAKPGVARTKVSRTVKLERKLNGTSAKTPFSMKTGLFTVTGFSVLPVEIPGYLVQRGETHTVFRHKVSSASKKMAVSVFANSDVLELVGKVDEIGSITVLQRKKFTEATGVLKFEGSTIVVTGAETVKYTSNDKVTYEIKALDLEGSQQSGRGAKSSEKEGKKSAKVSNIKEAKGDKKSKKK